MQRVVLNVPDNNFETVMTIVKNLKEDLISNYETSVLVDPYFEQRKQHLNQVYEQINNGQMAVYDFDTSMKELIAELEA